MDFPQLQNYEKKTIKKYAFCTIEYFHISNITYYILPCYREKQNVRRTESESESE